MDFTPITVATGVIYIFGCICVSVVANERGHDAFTPFIISFFASPIIGAILYSPYKKEEKEEQK